MSTATLKDARMELKTTSDLKSTLQKAAQLSGQDLTSFVLASAEAKAFEVMEQHNHLRLAEAAHHALLKALTSPPKPTEALRELMAEAPLARR
jgi:uncharacterized protein (DUF1778 family)